MTKSGAGPSPPADSAAELLRRPKPSVVNSAPSKVSEIRLVANWVCQEFCVSGVI